MAVSSPLNNQIRRGNLPSFVHQRTRVIGSEVRATTFGQCTALGRAPRGAVGESAREEGLASGAGPSPGGLRAADLSRFAGEVKRQIRWSTLDVAWWRSLHPGVVVRQLKGRPPE